jgi:hypothetical protein
VAPHDRDVEILDHAGGRAATARIGRELEEVELVRDRERPREVGEEDGARLQRRDEERIPARVGDRDLGAELRDAGGDLLPREVDLPDGAS